MADNSGEPPDQGDLAVMDSLARELRVGIGLAEGEVQRLIGRAFANTRSAEKGLRTLIGRGGVEHALAVMEKNSIARTWYYGGLRSDFRPWRYRTVYTALAELPEALRKLQHLLDRQRDLQLARREALRRGLRFTPDDDPPPSRPRGRGRGRN